ncbi:F-box protein At3g07870-like [Rutidosis leptorrhynchoides]|uniref:F-box protein At3g07870-like n=1 Tax=Rutidosis leptorrhynchoides TaxID=125765 RepID=UPI003A9999BF
MVEILVRLPVKTIIHCKCVCREWLNLISDSHFINLHLTKSPQCIMFRSYLSSCEDPPIVKEGSLILLEIEEQHGRRRLYHDPIMSVDLFPAPDFEAFIVYTHGSVNGLICLFGFEYGFDDMIYLCNPITREYIILPPREIKGNIHNSYGFGVSSLTGEYKVIRVFEDSKLPLHLKVNAEIYTLGTGQWRRLGHVPNSFGYTGTFLNNHVHWLLDDHENPLENICTFNIDNETFQLFPSPPVGLEEHDGKLVVLKGCLCYAYYPGPPGTCLDFSVWVMRDYGTIKNSWQKELVINEGIYSIIQSGFGYFGYPVGSLIDATILMANSQEDLFVYHQDTSTIEKSEFAGAWTISYRPSFLKLQDFKSEIVHKFSR